MLRIDQLPAAAKIGLPFDLNPIIDRPFDNVLALMCPDWRGPALVLEGPHWHVAHANRRCLDLIAAADGFAFLSEERLIFRDSVFHGRFQAYLDHATRFRVEPVMLIGETQNGWFSVAIRLAPWPYPDHVMVAFAITGQGFEPMARDAFAAAFDLTPAEMEVVELIAMGHGAEVAARRRGSALSTIRQRVKTVLAKTGCRRQLELARLVTALLPA